MPAARLQQRRAGRSSYAGPLGSAGGIVEGGVGALGSVSYCSGSSTIRSRGGGIGGGSHRCGLVDAEPGGVEGVGGSGAVKYGIGSSTSCRRDPAGGGDQFPYGGEKSSTSTSFAR